MRPPNTIPGTPRDRRDDYYRAGRPAPHKLASAGYVVSVQDSEDTVTVRVCGEDLSGVIPLEEMPPVGALCEVESRGDLLVIPLWFAGPPQPDWQQDPDFNVQTLTPRATHPTLEFSQDTQATGTSLENFTDAQAKIGAAVTAAWAATAGPSPEDAFLLPPNGGPESFPADAYSFHQHSVFYQSAVGSLFDGHWDWVVDADHVGWAVETRPNTSGLTYDDGPGIEWEAHQPQLVGATINVTVTATAESAAGSGPGVCELWVYWLALHNNQLSGTWDRKSLGTLSGTTTLDVELSASDLAGWVPNQGLMLYAFLGNPALPPAPVTDHNYTLAGRFTAQVDINTDPAASYWTVRPPRWRSV